MQFKITFVLLVAVVYMASAMVCPKDFCSKVDCGNKVEQNDCEQNKNGVFRERGTWCGCCPACLTKLTEGESCFGALLRGVPPRVACAPGLRCNAETRTCVQIE